MGGAGVTAGGGAAVPYVLPPTASPPSRREINYVCPLDPSCPLSQRKVYVKNLRNVSKHCTVNVEFLFISGR